MYFFCLDRAADCITGTFTQYDDPALATLYTRSIAPAVPTAAYRALGLAQRIGCLAHFAMRAGSGLEAIWRKLPSTILKSGPVGIATFCR
jgi:hypothetical protein